MRILFQLTQSEPGPEDRIFVRDSARAIILRDGRVAMVHSQKYDYWKFPGGGIEPGETREAALCRETREEAGLTVIPGSIREYGMVHRAEPREGAEWFVQDNYYYLCEAEPERVSQDLDDYEAEERFTFAFVDPETAIAANRKPDHGPKSPLMIEREARVLELLISEGYFV